eukprot:1673108-Pleurochrysis_carterae.AAC.4
MLWVGSHLQRLRPRSWRGVIARCGLIPTCRPVWANFACPPKVRIKRVHFPLQNSPYATDGLLSPNVENREFNIWVEAQLGERNRIGDGPRRSVRIDDVHGGRAVVEGLRPHLKVRQGVGIRIDRWGKA